MTQLDCKCNYNNSVFMYMVMIMVWDAPSLKNIEKIHVSRVSFSIFFLMSFQDEESAAVENIFLKMA